MRAVHAAPAPAARGIEYANSQDASCRKHNTARRSAAHFVIIRVQHVHSSPAPLIGLVHAVQQHPAVLRRQRLPAAVVPATPRREPPM
jgi:hypothetical protein